MNDSDHVLAAPMDYGEDRPKADNPLQIMDVSLRDGQQSLFGGRGRTEDMISVAERMDEIGFWAVEIGGGATFDVAHRVLNEDPWERIRIVKQKFNQTPLAMALRSQSLVGHRLYPDDVSRAFVEAAAANGIDVFRTFDALNDFRNYEVIFDSVRAAEKHFQGCICYALTEPRMGGQVFNLAYYVDKAKALEAMGVDSICIKDLAGLLAPYDGYALIKGIKEATTVPIHLHSHFTSGMAPMTHLKAIEAGVDLVDACLFSYAYRTSHPAIEPLVMTLLGTNRDTGFDGAKLARINETLEKDVLPKYASLIDASKVSTPETDALAKQLPPGMISDIRGKLEQMDALDKIGRAYEELPAVRRDLGQAPLVTPIYQIVGTQAVNNAVFDDDNERYKMIADQTRDLCFGLYGATPGPIDPDLLKKALKDYPEGETPLTGRPAEGMDPELGKAKEAAEGLAQGVEDEILYALFPVSGKQFLKWKHGKEDPPPSTIPKTLDDARSELSMLEKLRAGESVGILDAPIPEKGKNLRVFNVFVDDDYFEVGVGEAGGSQAVSYVKPASSPAQIQPKTAVKPVKPAASPPVPAPAAAPPPSSAPAEAPPTAAVDGVALIAPMPGTIVNYEKQVGDSVTEGETVLVLEAMKMENALPAPASGVIKSIDFKDGDTVAKGDVLCVIG